MVWSQSKPLLDKLVYNSHFLLFHSMLPLLPSLPISINLTPNYLIPLVIPSIPINFGNIVNFSLNLMRTTTKFNVILRKQIPNW